MEFSPDELDDVVAAMAAVAEAGRGWVNFEPSIPVEDVAATERGVFTLFSARGPAVPLGTWTPPSAPRRGRAEPAMVGLQHGIGAKVKARLAEAGHPVPEGWVVVQDSAKKGLVAAVPPSTDLVDVVRWVVGAAGRVSAIPLTGWRAAVYEPAGARP